MSSYTAISAARTSGLRMSFLLGVLVVALAGLAGCSSGARSLKLDEPVARQSFEAFLTAWRDGKAPDDLAKQSPQIICGDFEWRSGRKLMSFKVLDQQFSDGTNLKLTAELVLVTNGTAGAPEVVEYVVGTSPVITIFRP